jgi:enamine deaminase RidA (YjgF/YER057c/UK114 family)
MTMTVHHSPDEGVHTAVAGTGPVQTAYATLWPVGDEDETAMVNKMLRVADERGGAVVKCDVFGSCGRHAGFMRRLESAFPPCGLPVTWVEGGSTSGAPIAGITVRFVSGADVQTVFLGPSPVGRVYEDTYGRYCLLCGVHTDATSAMRGQQVLLTLEALEAGLNAAGMDMTCLARTWFYNDSLLEWYGIFNEVRTRFYRERGVLDSVVPASTGIGGKNPHGSALVAGAEAMVFKSRDASIQEVASPLQNQAITYGSAFSRAVLMQSPHEKRLIVSGTASINETGRTVFAGALDAQIEQTMKVVAALLGSQGMGWPNVVRSIAYVKNPAGAGEFSRFLASSSLPVFPCIVAHNEICRDDLLFEIEVDAVNVS